MRNLGKKYQYYCKCVKCETYFELSKFKNAGLYCSMKCRNAANYINNKIKSGLKPNNSTVGEGQDVSR